MDDGRVPTVRVVPPHGARARYLHRSLACRCPVCTAANTRYIADYRRRLYTEREVRAGRAVQLSLPAELLPTARR